MWREESGILEMFLAYYSQFEQNLAQKKAYRDFLFDILCLHEDSCKSVPVCPSKIAVIDKTSSLSLTLPTEDLISLEEKEKKTEDPMDNTRSSFLLIEDIQSSTSEETPCDLRTFNNSREEKNFTEPLSENVNSMPNDETDPFESKFLSYPNDKGPQDSEDIMEQCLYIASCSIATQCSSLQISKECFQNAITRLLQAASNHCPDGPSEEHRLTNGADAFHHKAVNRFRRDPPYVCKVCNENFICGRDFVNHRRIHTEVRLYTCSFCKKSFKKEYSLKKHERIHSDDRPFSCSQCLRTFKQESALKTHERTHTDDRPYVCKLCERQFRYLSSLRAHDRTHSGERPYVCTLCQRSFKFASSLSAHVSSHSNERPYACKMCDRRYTQRGSLYRHQAFPCTKPANQ